MSRRKSLSSSRLSKRNLTRKMKPLSSGAGKDCRLRNSATQIVAVMVEDLCIYSHRILNFKSNQKYYLHLQAGKSLSLSGCTGDNRRKRRSMSQCYRVRTRQFRARCSECLKLSKNMKYQTLTVLRGLWSREKSTQFLRLKSTLRFPFCSSAPTETA